MDDAINVLDISVSVQEEVIGSIPSLIKQRRNILPNPDHLDEILINDDKQNLVLIPRAKKQSKNGKSEYISRYYDEQTVPPTELEKWPKRCSELDIIGAIA